MRLQTIIIFLLTLAGFALRLHYLATTHPFFDEYTTVLAARQILRYGWPVLPSGLFYEHGLLATYVIAPFTALFINIPLDQWQPAHWGLMLSRWPSVLIGTATIPLIYTLGRRGFSSLEHAQPRFAASAALLAAGLFAFSPEGMVWGGRARMYALATLLVLLTVYLAYRGALYPAPTKYRWGAMFTLLAALLTQLSVLTLIPPLVLGMIVIGWLSTQHPNLKSQIPNSESRVWFLRPAIFPESLTLAAVIGLAVYVKRLGRPLGFDTLSAVDNGNMLPELLNTLTYQTTFHFTWPDTVKFLTRQFGVPHHFWLTIIAIVGATVGVVFWLSKMRNQKQSASKFLFLDSYLPLFLWLVFGFIVLEMVSLLEPFRRNPRYIVMYLPLFYLIAAQAVFNFRFICQFILHLMFHALRFTPYVSRFVLSLITIILLALFIAIGFNDLRLALVTPEPAYEEALAFVQTHWQPGDTLLTMNTPAAGLYLDHADGFTVQEDAEQFLLSANSVDRWLGAPWVGTAADFNAALNASERAWFIIDTIRQPVYFRGDWLAVVNNQMEQVWAKDNALVYRTRPNRTPLPAQPDTLTKATLGHSVELLGYALDGSPHSALDLTLFWRPLALLPTDYTVFLHLRDQDGDTVAQRDRQPLDGAYPTTHWQPGETVIDSITLTLPEDLPAGTYTLFVGLYQLDTGERLPVANDASGENAIVLGEVTINGQ